MLRKHVVAVRRVGTEHFASQLRTKALSAPALLVRAPRPHEKYELTVLAIWPKDSHGPRFAHTGEIKEIAIGLVSPP
jgi:hypothetical protein